MSVAPTTERASGLRGGSEENDRVVLLHGVFRRSGSMASLARRLERERYRTLNLDYPATRHGLAALAELIHPAIAAFDAGNPGALHFVTHSMGGLVARVYLARHRPPHLGRVVMLTPPNGGSELADRHENAFWYRMVFGPAGRQLTTAHAATLPVPDCRVGVVAGGRSLYPMASRRIPGPNDGRVSLASTKLPSSCPAAGNWIVVAAAHPVIMRHRDAVSATLAFLSDGRFGPTSP